MQSETVSLKHLASRTKTIIYEHDLIKTMAGVARKAFTKKRNNQKLIYISIMKASYI